MNLWICKKVLAIRLVAILCISMVVSPNTYSQTEVALGIGSAAAQLLAADEMVNNIIEKAAENANYVVFETASQLKIVIEAMRLSLNDVLEKGFDELNGSQQLAFQNLQKSIVQLEQGVAAPLEEARNLSDSAKQLVSDINPLLTTVTVTRSHPSVIGPADDREFVLFTVNGVNLDQSDPRMSIGETEATRVELKQQKVVFQISSEALPNQPDSLDVLTGKIELKIEKCRFWWFFCSDGYKPFEMAVMLLPKQLATLDLEYTTKNEVRQYADRTFSRNVAKSTGDLTNWKCTTFSQGPHQPGWFIDTASLKGVITKAGGKHRNKTLTNNTTGFSVELCGKSVINGFKKKTGEVFMSYSWKEYQMGSEISPVVQAETGKALDWDSAYNTTLPQDANAIAINIRYFDGTSRTAIGGYRDDYIDVQWNDSTKQLVATPINPSTIKEVY